MKHTLTAFIATVVLAATAPLIAHHGAATFDTGKELTMQGTVTEWVWSNPHCFLKFDVMEKDGTVRHWTVETSNPPDMVNRGWSRRSFKGGEKVTVDRGTGQERQPGRAPADGHAARRQSVEHAGLTRRREERDGRITCHVASCSPA